MLLLKVLGCLIVLALGACVVVALAALREDDPQVWLDDEVMSQEWQRENEVGWKR